MSIVQQINEGLQALGFSQSLAAQLDQFISCFLWHFPTQSRQRWRLSCASVSSLLL